MAKYITYCNECIYWKRLTAGSSHPFVAGFGHCQKRAPMPCQHNGTPDQPPGFFEVHWPHTHENFGCWEGEQL